MLLGVSLLRVSLGLRGLVYVGLLWELSLRVCLAQEIRLDDYERLDDGDLYVDFETEFPSATLGDVEEVKNFAEIFTQVLGKAIDIPPNTLLIHKVSSPPLKLTARAEFRRGVTIDPTRLHTREAVRFHEQLDTVAVRNAVQSDLEDYDFSKLGQVNFVSIERPTVQQDVRVVLPRGMEEDVETTSPFFKEHPEVLASIFLILLLMAVLAALCWYICRTQPQPVVEKKASSRKLSKQTTAPQKKHTGSRLSKERSASMKQAMPTTITDPTQPKKLPSKNRLEFETLDFIERIGKGSFKTVFRGRWGSNNVAIVRMRKGGALLEARLMQKLSSHPNLVTFYRWACDNLENEYIVMELLPLGSLDVLLRRPGVSVSNKAKRAMCEQICQAMCELAREGVLHRDLAARNVLVQSLDPVNVKVSDFGLAKYVSPNVASSPACLLPVRWIPPEVILKQAWSEKSDVWAFGVTMWEIFSNGCEPYTPEIPSTEEVVDFVLHGGRLPKPANCPEKMYLMMLECWHTKPSDRPDFQELARRFQAPLVRAQVKDTPPETPSTGRNEIRIDIPSRSGDVAPNVDAQDNDQKSYQPETPDIESQPQPMREMSVPLEKPKAAAVANEMRGQGKPPKAGEQREIAPRPQLQQEASLMEANCESLSSIPDPEFHPESDYDEAIADGEPGTSNQADKNGVARGSKQASDIGTKTLIQCQLPFKQDNKAGRSVGESPPHNRAHPALNSVETSPYADIRDIMG